jgi:hypothetical protein
MRNCGCEFNVLFLQLHSNPSSANENTVLRAQAAARVRSSSGVPMLVKLG